MSKFVMVLPSILVVIAVAAIYVSINEDLFTARIKRIREELEVEALTREALFSTPGIRKNAEFKLHRLGYNISYRYFLIINGLIGVILAFLSVLFMNNPALGILSAVIWMILIHKFLDDVYVKKVKEPMAEQAELALQLLAEVYEVTKDLIEAFRQVTPAVKSPLKEEMEVFIQDYNMNKDLNTCLLEFSERVDNRDIETFARGIILSLFYGTDTYEVLRQTSDIIRERRELQEELKNETRGRSATILIFQIAVPVVLIILLFKSPSARDIFLYSAKGQNLVCLALLAEFITWYFSKRKGVSEQF
ncbi:Flp pilus assembly protein TadB [Desulfotomaculum arcticum]|uniref:Flp pilus assembly protein TadB n=1 Tax=Desulfotruncus arcticus DSM 17038 TaxID=1121424 RepID=A0A1I2Z8U8_9FIRM|nr:type II secretion system F family protein [Desulfotruncus arcticus]SFH33936.1 Flp pilus assembly protein TadB [Desulfotomaculum arcticum] [Desulfotruncus arcticus DSM 17038]